MIFKPEVVYQQELRFCYDHPGKQRQWYQDNGNGEKIFNRCCRVKHQGDKYTHQGPAQMSFMPDIVAVGPDTVNRIKHVYKTE